MSRLSPDTVWKRIVMYTRLPARAGIMALEQIARPYLNLLRRLLSQKTTPPRLRLLAASKYADPTAMKESLTVPGCSEDAEDRRESTIEQRIAELCGGMTR